MEQEEVKLPWRTQLVKYFLHGVAFSAISLLLNLMLPFFLELFMTVGSFTASMIGIIIGSALGLILAFLVLGFVDASITEFVWNVSLDSNWRNILSSGFYLTFGIFIAQLPALAWTVFYPIDDVRLNLARSVGLFVMYAFIYGFLGKELAPPLKEEGELTEEHRTKLV